MAKVDNITVAKEKISEKDMEKAKVVSEILPSLEAEKKRLVDGIKADIESAYFWFKLVDYKVYRELPSAYKTLSDFVEGEFDVKPIVGKLTKTKRILQIVKRIQYLATIGNPTFSKKKEEKKKEIITTYQRIVKLLDDCTVDDMILLQAEIEKRLSASESAEKEEKEELKKAA
jgi:hypothetical protein